MIAVLGLEEIGSDAAHRGAVASMGRAEGYLADHRIRQAARYAGRPRAWVARITGRDPRYGLAREFVGSKRDFAEANGTGSRGVYRWYELDEGGVYEVNAPLSWKHADRYFCRSERGKVVRMSREEVESWLTANGSAASASTS